MNALSREILPAMLAGRLTDEQKQTVLEAPRGQRVATVAAALGLTEPDALALVAQATGLDVASDIRPDRAALGLTPARLVHDYQVVPILEPGAGPAAEADDDLKPATEDSKQELHLATAWPPDAVMLDWVRTFTPRPLRWHLALPDRVHQLIIEHYGVGSGSLEDSSEDFAPVQNPQGIQAPLREELNVREVGGTRRLPHGHDESRLIAVQQHPAQGIVCRRRDKPLLRVRGRFGVGEVIKGEKVIEAPVENLLFRR